jgi:hypothetical protein
LRDWHECADADAEGAVLALLLVTAFLPPLSATASEPELEPDEDEEDEDDFVVEPELLDEPPVKM